MANSGECKTIGLEHVTVLPTIFIPVQPCHNSEDLEDLGSSQGRTQSSNSIINPGADLQNCLIEMTSTEENENNDIRQAAENIQTGKILKNTETKDDQITNYKTASHIQGYLNWIYYLAVSPVYMHDGTQKHSNFSSILQLILFWLFCACSIIESVKLVKTIALRFVEGHKLITLVTLALFILNFFGRLSFVKIIGFHQNNIMQMVQRVNDFLKIHKDGEPNAHSKVAFFIFVFAMTSWVCSLASSIFGGMSIRDWSLGEAIQTNSRYLATDLFLWDQSNDTSDYIYNQFYFTTTPFTLFLGGLETIFQFCGSLQDYVVEDIVLMAALTLNECVKVFNHNVNKLHVPNNGPNNLLSIWKQYKDFWEISKSMNESVGYLITFLHFNNLLLFGYFLLTLLGKFQLDIQLLFTIFRIIKSLFIYYIAAKTANTNSKFRSWIHETCWKKDSATIGESVANANVLLDEIKSKSISLGDGAFKIDREFIVKFFTLVASYFLFHVKELKYD